MNRSVIKLLIFSTTFLLVSGAALSYVLYGQNTKGKQLMSYLEGLESWSQLSQAREELNSKAEVGKSDSERLATLVLSGQNDTIALLSHIDELGDRVGVVIGTNDLRSDRTSEVGFDEIVVTLTLNGSVQSVELMLALLELLPYRSRIESLTMTRMGDTAEATVVLRVSTLE